MLELESRRLRRELPASTRRWLPLPIPPQGWEQLQSADDRMTPEWVRLVELVTQPDEFESWAPGELTETFGK